MQVLGKKYLVKGALLSYGSFLPEAFNISRALECLCTYSCPYKNAACLLYLYYTLVDLEASVCLKVY